MIVNIILAIVIIVQAYLNYKLVKDLSLKIKSRDLAEYERILRKPEKKEPEIPVVSADEADEREYLKALQK